MKYLLPFPLIENKQDRFNYDDYELHYWHPTEREMFLRYDEIKKSKNITHDEAALLIAADDKLFVDIADYKYQNTPLPKESTQRLLKILSRVIPVDKVFYRGVERENYDDYHIMKVQSWALNKSVAKWFGIYIYQTIEPCKGVELENIYFWNGLINKKGDGFGDSQAEWFLLNPKKELIK